MTNNGEVPSNSQKNLLQKVGVAGVGLLALVGSVQLMQDSLHRRNNSMDFVEASGKSMNTGEEIIASELVYGSPVKYLNGALTEPNKDGSEKWYPYPIVVYSGNPYVTSKLDPANFHFFTATQQDGVPTVTEIEVTPNMKISGLQNDTDLLTIEAILTPASDPNVAASPSFNHNSYVVKSYPDELYIVQGGKGGLQEVGGLPVVIPG